MRRSLERGVSAVSVSIVDLLLGVVAVEFARVRAMLALEAVPYLSQHLQHQLRQRDGAHAGEAEQPPEAGPPWHPAS